MKNINLYIDDAVSVAIDHAVLRRSLAMTRPRASRSGFVREALAALLSAETGFTSANAGVPREKNEKEA